MSHRQLPQPAWLEELPEPHRRILRKFGIAPDSDPRAANFNARVIALAEQGMRGMELAMAANALHDEFFGDALTRRANAEHFSELIEVNRAGDIDQLAFVLCGHGGEIEAGLVGGSDAPYVMRCIGAVADVIEGSRLDLNSAGLLPEPPPASAISAEERADYRSRVDEVLRALVADNERGSIAGTAAIVFSRRGTIYRLVGTIGPDALVRALRALRDRIALGRPGQHHDAAN